MISPAIRHCRMFLVVVVVMAVVALVPSKVDATTTAPTAECGDVLDDGTVYDCLDECTLGSCDVSRTQKNYVKFRGKGGDNTSMQSNTQLTFFGKNGYCTFWGGMGTGDDATCDTIYPYGESLKVLQNVGLATVTLCELTVGSQGTNFPDGIMVNGTF